MVDVANRGRSRTFQIRPGRQHILTRFPPDLQRVIVNEHEELGRIGITADHQNETLRKAAADALGKIGVIEKLPNASGVKPLAGNLAGWYRARTGDYRIRFRVQGEKVIVGKIGHRKDVYDD